MTTDKNPIHVVEDHPLEAFDLLKQIKDSQCQIAFNKDDTVSEDDRVNHPSYYMWLKDLCGIEVIDITRHMDFDLGNAIKYILRQGRKSEEGITDKQKAIEDLKKAVFYLNDKIKMLER